MSIARALTRRARGSSNEESTPVAPTPIRSGTLRSKDYRQVDRTKISLPVTLLSSTNNLAYDAPDIPKINTITLPSISAISPSLSSATSSRRSFEGSESGASSATSISTPALSREGSPVYDTHGYFPHKKPFGDSPPTPLSPGLKEIEIAPTTPAVPNRALSHTKHTHQAMARQRSESRLSGENQFGTESRTISRELTASPVEEHPFGAELAKVMEVAEEFGVQNVHIWDEETQFLMDNDLGHFTAEDYMNEIQPLFGKAFFETAMVSNTASWL